MEPEGWTDARFRVIRKLGRGGYGAVYEAVPAGSPDQRVALKVLHLPSEADPAFERRFIREARNIARLRSPHVVRVLEHGTLQDGRRFLAMELCRGPSLRVLQSRASIEVERAVRLTTHVLRGLSVAHRLSMVHRDIKPDNVHVETDGEGFEIAKVLDFGLAKIVTGRQSQDLTQQGQILGTLAYIAPEQLFGDPVDPRADLFATGVMLFELLQGHLPFPATSPSGLVRAYLQEQVPSLFVCTRGRVSSSLDAVVSRMLATDPDARWPTAEETIAALLDAEPGAARPGRPTEHWSQSRPTPEQAARSTVRLFARTREVGGPDSEAPTVDVPSPTVDVPPPTGAVPAPAAAGVASAAPPPPPLARSSRGAAPPASEAADSAQGGPDLHTLGGRFVLYRLVSRSARGEAFQAVDLESGRGAWVKVLAGHGAVPDSAMRRYLRGIQALAGVRHRHVVRLLGGGVSPDGHPFFATEWVPGAPLREFLSRGLVPVAEACGATCQLLEGLSALHAAGVVHRDVSPAHVLVAPTERSAVVKLSGFGIARAVIGRDGTRTAWGGTLGSYAYMSPEQHAGQRLDPRSDLYAVAAVLYEMLAGHPPHAGVSPVEVIRSMHASPAPALPVSLAVEVRSRVDPVLARALAPDRDRRFSSAGEMRAALLPLAGDQAQGDFAGLSDVG